MISADHTTVEFEFHFTYFFLIRFWPFHPNILDTLRTVYCRRAGRRTLHLNERGVKEPGVIMRTNQGTLVVEYIVGGHPFRLRGHSSNSVALSILLPGGEYLRHLRHVLLLAAIAGRAALCRWGSAIGIVSSRNIRMLLSLDYHKFMRWSSHSIYHRRFRATRRLRQRLVTAAYDGGV